MKKIICFAILLFLAAGNNVDAVEMVVRVAFDPNMPPYQFIENEECKGIHIDAMNEIAKKYNFIVKYISLQGTSKCFEALEKGSVDMVLGVENDCRINRNVYYTDTLSQSQICVITSKKKATIIQNMFSIDNYTAAVEDGTVRYSYIRNMRNLKYTVAPNQIHAFNLLVDNNVDLLIGVKHSILYQLEKNNYIDDYVIVNNYITPIEYYIAVQKGHDDLLVKLNDGIRQLRISGKYEVIYKNWINEDSYAVKNLTNKIIKIFVTILLSILIILTFNIYINRYLKRLVDEKTIELKKINKNLECQITKTRNYNELKNCIVENSPSGIVAFDCFFKITLFNNNIIKTSEFSNLRIGCNIFDSELFANILKNKKENIFTDNKRYINEEIETIDKNGEKIVFRYNIYQLFNADKKVSGAILNIDNVTTEIKLKNEINEKEKNKALNQIIAGIAHEIRNPLMSIKTFVELIPTKIENVTFQTKIVEYVPKEVERVSNLIKNLIDYAKPSELNKEYVYVEDIIQSCNVLISPLLANKKIMFNIDVEKNLVVYADRNKLKQIIINIILNSYESMQDKLKTCNKLALNMYIKAWNDEQYICIQVIDEGMGMTADEIKKSTDLFFTTKSKGSGIGLSISKQLTEENGGMMIIESEKFLSTTITLKFRRQV